MVVAEGYQGDARVVEWDVGMFGRTEGGGLLGWR
jgi:hypothetical protein